MCSLLLIIRQNIRKNFQGKRIQKARREIKRYLRNIIFDDFGVEALLKRCCCKWKSLLESYEWLTILPLDFEKNGGVLTTRWILNKICVAVCFSNCSARLPVSRDLKAVVGNPRNHVKKSKKCKAFR